MRPEPTAASPRPPWHGNWYREWSIGRFAFEIEWVPRGRCYTFTFSINTPEKHLRRMEQEAGPPCDARSRPCCRDAGATAYGHRGGRVSDQPLQKVSAEALAEHRAKQDAAYARSAATALPPGMSPTVKVITDKFVGIYCAKDGFPRMPAWVAATAAVEAVLRGE